MATLNCIKDIKVITCGLKFLLQVNDNATIKEVPKPLKTDNENEASKDTKDIEMKKNSSEELKINCSSVSFCGKFLALCDDYKQISVWTLPALSLIYQQNLVRKASKVIFTPDSKHILVADKNGDVYKFKTEIASEAQLLLGHLSMLLDIQMDPKGKFVLTADRDEKIRVSKFPNSYNIHNYCLGHTEFVTSICLFGDDLLLSGSGDGSVKVWKYLEGREILSHQVFKDVEIEVQDDMENMNVKDDLENLEMEKNGVKRVDPPAQPAVVSLRILKNNLFLVQIEGYKGICVYEFNNNKLALKQELKLNSFLLDYDISEQQLFLLNKSEESVSLDIYKIVESGLEKESSVLLEEHQEFFSPVDNYENEGVKNLHKRWFDNVKDYMERKEARVSKTKVSQPPAVKKQKCEV